MSALAPRARGGNPARGSRGATSTPFAGRGASRGRQAAAARGSTRGARGAAVSSSSGGQGLLQQLRTGTVARNGQDGGAATGRGRGATRGTAPARGRGRGNLTRSFDTFSNNDSPAQSRGSSSAPFGSSDATAMSGDVNQRYTQLKNLREEERKEAIRMGFLADPDKKTTLDQAITPVGTCEEMCPPFERVERIVQFMVDRCEKTSADGGKPVASEEIMVKRFRRSAAGDDEQIPSDIRTPATLRRTLDYLIDDLVGGPERLAVVHKFVWDRTRAIRNDFSIQQVSKDEDVRTAVECFERIARFHILSLHQLSNPDNLREDENFDVFQDREQLNNTLLSLLFYYDDHRNQIDFPNEAEFRAYHIIMAIQGQFPDIEDRIQSWPPHLIADARVQTALRLYQAAGDTLFDHGPLRPTAPSPVARNNSGNFWTIMNSGAVGYHLACVAEMYFNQVRFVALSCLVTSAKSAPQSQQQKSRDWTIVAVSEYLGFDLDEQTVDFCATFGLSFQKDAQNVTYLDVASYGTSSLDQSALSSKHTFSHTFVEEKRCRRTFPAIINNVSTADAIRQGLVELDDSTGQEEEAQDDGDSLFIPENKPKSTFGQGLSSSFGSFNPQAATFTPSSSFGTSALPASSPFGSGAAALTSSPFGLSKTFGGAATSNTTDAATAPQNTGFSTIFGQTFGAPKDTAPEVSRKFGEATGTNSIFGKGFANTSSEAGPLSADEGTSITQTSPPSHIVNFGTTRPSNTENNPFGGPGEPAKPAVPGFISDFGKPRASNTLNNPFGQPPAALSSGAPPSAAAGSGLGANGAVDFGSSSTTTKSPFTFNNPFTKPTPPSDQAAESAAPASQPSTTSSEPSKPLFQGFNFGSTSSVSDSQSQAQAQPSQPTASGTTTRSTPFSFFAPTSQPAAPSAPTASTSPVQSSLAPPKPVFDFTKAAPAGQPVFSFTKASDTSSSASPSQPAFTFGLPQTTPSTSSPPAAPPPPAVATAPPISQASQPPFKFPSLNPQPPAEPSPAQSQPSALPGASQKDTTTQTPAASSSQVKPSTTFTTTPPSTSPKSTPTPAFSAQGQSAQPKKPAFDRERQIDLLVRLAFTQRYGLLFQFLEATIPNILREEVKKYEEDQFQEAVARLKAQYLFRKYGAIWRNIAWQRNLNKRANKRRQAFAESVRMEAEKKIRSEKELQSILEAVEENKRIKAEIQQRKKIEAASPARERPEPAQLAGSKRKSLGEQHVNTPQKFSQSKISNHKRSRTIGMMQPPPLPNKVAQLPQQGFRHSVFTPPGGTSLNRSSSGSNLRQSMARSRQDQTKTDYFRLIAEGIDPDTPHIPLTARQVEARQQKDQEERAAAIARAQDRRRVTLTQPQQTQSVTSAATSPSAASPPLLPAISRSPSAVGATVGSASNYDPSTDELLQQLRQARLDLASDTTWFKEQATKLEKEVEEEEKFRSSTGSTPGVRPVDHGLSILGGHAYSPAPPSMSRVEARIRKSGALGLAYKAIGTPSERPTSRASSKRNSGEYESGHDREIETNGTAKKRRRKGDVDRSYRPSQQELEDEEEHLNMVSPQKRTKKHATPAPKNAAVKSKPLQGYQPSANRFALPANEEYDTEEDDALYDDDEDEVQHPTLQSQAVFPHHNGRLYPVDRQQQEQEEEELYDEEEEVSIEDGDQQDAEDGEEYDEDDEEEEEELEDDDLDDAGPGYAFTQGNQYLQPSSLFYPEPEDAPTPNTQATSRATSSGPGATAEDALVLSDSD